MKKTISRAVLAVAMIGIGAMHFVRPDAFARIVPRALPWPLALVYVSGVFEILGGAGLLIERTRRAAGIGLIALYVAVFPANVNMAVNDIQPGGYTIPEALLWLRLPLQAALVWWAWKVSRGERRVATRETTRAATLARADPIDASQRRK